MSWNHEGANDAGTRAYGVMFCQCSLYGVLSTVIFEMDVIEDTSDSRISPSAYCFIRFALIQMLLRYCYIFP